MGMCCFQFELVLLSVVIIKKSQTQKVICDSCFNGCPSIDNCDCRPRDTNYTCTGDYCFVDLRNVASSNAATIFKGCGIKSDEKVLDPGIIGCNYQETKNIIKCYCKSNLCNRKSNLNDYKPKFRESVDCCACEAQGQEDDVGCAPGVCNRNCTGHYCFVDMAKQAQGCGYGFPSLLEDFRTSHSSMWIPQFDQSCGLELAGDVGPYWKRSCQCGSNRCNDIQAAYDRDKNHTQRVNVRQIYCHNFHNSSSEPPNLSSYEDSHYCEGHYCFLTFKTGVESRASADGPVLSVKYELAAGCLMSDDREKVRLGCTTEYLAGSTAPYVKRCICQDDYCNLYNLMSGESPDKWLIFKINGAFSTRHSFVMFGFAGIILLYHF